MGLLDSILGSVLGGGQSQQQNPLLGILSGLLQGQGGLQGLMSKFQQGGLGSVFASWVGTGENHGISADQIQSVLGSDTVRDIAGKLGIDPSKAGELLSQHLPNVVNGLTPNGEIDQNQDITQGLSALLPNLLKGLS